MTSRVHRRITLPPLPSLRAPMPTLNTEPPRRKPGPKPQRDPLVRLAQLAVDAMADKLAKPRSGSDPAQLRSGGWR
jgi:hypothetical protein